MNLFFFRAIFRWITVKDLNVLEFEEVLDTDTPLGLLRGIKFGTETYHTLFMRLCRSVHRGQNEKIRWKEENRRIEENIGQNVKKIKRKGIFGSNCSIFPDNWTANEPGHAKTGLTVSALVTQSRLGWQPPHQAFSWYDTNWRIVLCCVPRFSYLACSVSCQNKACGNWVVTS